MYSKKLRIIRKELNLSQEEMALKTATSYRAYASYERGDRKPSLEFLKNLVEVFKINLNWLIANSGEPFEKSEEAENNNFKKEIVVEIKNMLIEEGILK